MLGRGACKRVGRERERDRERDRERERRALLGRDMQEARDVGHEA